MPNPDNDALRHFATGGLVDPDDFNLYPRSDELHQLLLQRLMSDAPRSIVVSGPNRPSNRFDKRFDIEVRANDRPSWVPADAIVWAEDPIGDLRKRELRGDLVTMLARLREQKQREIETEQDRLLRLTANLPDAWI